MADQWQIQGGVGGAAAPLLTGCILKQVKNFAPKCMILDKILKHFLGRGLCPFPRSHSPPFRPPIPNFWIHHCG